MTATIALAAAVLASLALAAFCAGAETAFMSVGRGRIVHLEREGSEAAGIVGKALAGMNRTLTGLLIGNNLAHVAFSSAAAALGARLFSGRPDARAVWTVLSAFLVLYAAEFIPKLFCSTRPLARSLRLAGFYRAFETAVRPLSSAAMAVTGLFAGREEQKEKTTASDVLRILEDGRDGVRLTDFESALVSRILVLRRKNNPVTPEALMAVLEDGQARD